MAAALVAAAVAAVAVVGAEAVVAVVLDGAVLEHAHTLQVHAHTLLVGALSDAHATCDAAFELVGGVSWDVF